MRCRELYLYLGTVEGRQNSKHTTVSTFYVAYVSFGRFTSFLAILAQSTTVFVCRLIFGR